GLGVTGFGGSLGVVTVQKDTQAFIGTAATVDGLTAIGSRPSALGQKKAAPGREPIADADRRRRPPGGGPRPAAWRSSGRRGGGRPRGPGRCARGAARPPPGPRS